MSQISALDDPKAETPRRGAMLGVALLAPLVWSAPVPEPGRWVALGLYLLIGGIVLLRVAAFHPHRRFGPANMVTLVRAAGASVLLGFAFGSGFAGPVPWVLSGLSLAMILLDGVDGWLARRTGLASRFGARFDMEIDALTILILASIVWQLGKAGPWVLMLGLVRYLFVAAIWIWPSLGAPLPPSFRRKAVCVAQLAALTLCLLPPVAVPWSEGPLALALGALLWSFAVDLRWLVR